MNPIIAFAIVGIAVAAMGTGYLTNGFTMNLQQLGVQEKDLVSPISAANIDLELAKLMMDPDGIPDTGDEYFVNVITACSFHSPDALRFSSTLICKLTDKDGKAVAEGKLSSNTFSYLQSSTLIIPIDERIYDEGIPGNQRCVTTVQGVQPPEVKTDCQVAFENANDVQNVHDVKIVVLGPKPQVIH